jgi:hypothetical protein
MPDTNPSERSPCACRFVLDGSNIALLHGRANPELRYVLALFDYLDNCGDVWVCFFDANMTYLLQEHRPEQCEVFEQIVHDSRWSACIHVVPGGSEADKWILERAKADGAEVISNDRFRDRARDHRWIWKRRHGLRADSQRVRLETLDLDLPVLPTARDYLQG